MIKNNKNGKVLNVLLAIIALCVIVFIITWIINRGNNSNKLDVEFKNNLDNFQETAKKYFANELPKEVGDSTVITLNEMYEKDIEKEKIKNSNDECDDTLSYISATKISDNEYKIKANLVCGTKSDSIVEKISAKTVVKNKDGEKLLDSEKDDIKVDIKDNTDKKDVTTNTTITNNNDELCSSDGKTANVKCDGINCAVTEIPTTCTTTYEWEFVKRNVSCPSGFTLSNGTCVRYTNDTTNPIYDYDLITKVVDAKVNKGGSYKQYVPYTITGGGKKTYCKKGTLKSDGYCYEYADKKSEKTEKCPTGYTRKGDYCYKYTDIIKQEKNTCPTGYTKDGNYCYLYAAIIKTTTKTCPTGYTKSGNYCYMYATPTSTPHTTYSCSVGTLSGTSCITSPSYSCTNWGNPTRTYQTTTKESTYETQTEKKVLVGQNTIAGKTVYTYSVYNRSCSNKCSVGQLSGNSCVSPASGNTTYSTSCPSGYTYNNGTCYTRISVTKKTKKTCPTGFTKKNDTCYKKTNVNTETTYYCPLGYTKDNNTCYIKENVEKKTKYYCPTGYDDNGINCYRKSSPYTESKDAIYSCPDGFIKKGEKENTICYKVVKNNDTYYCENAKATLKGKLCYYKEKGNGRYSCPSGYTFVKGTCVGTNSEVTTPTWTTLDTIYSYNNYVPGYSKTGVAKFVTTCTITNPIYK